MKKIFTALFLLIICTALLLACGRDRETIEEKPSVESEIGKEENTYTFGYSCISMDDNPYFIQLEKSLREAIEASGHTLITKDAELDAELQAEQIEELIKKDIDAIFLTPVDWEKITPSIKRLKEADIKIINIDTNVQAMDLVDAYVGSDNMQAGQLCGEDMLKRLPNGGQIIVVECPNRNSIIERMNGFERTIANQGFEVVARIDAQARLELALPEVEAALKQYPNVVAIMCGNDQTAIGALIAANTVVAENVLIYGIDGSPEIKEEIAKEDSKVAATVAQSTKEMGKEAAAVALRIMNGEKYEKNTYIDTILITKENVSEYGTDEWQ